MNIAKDTSMPADDNKLLYLGQIEHLVQSRWIKALVNKGAVITKR